MVRLFCKLLKLLLTFPGQLTVILILIYQYIVAPYLPANCCRFKLSCSQYVKLAIIKYGWLRGLSKGFIRLLKCQPWFLRTDKLEY